MSAPVIPSNKAKNSTEDVSIKDKTILPVESPLKSSSFSSAQKSTNTLSGEHTKSLRAVNQSSTQPTTDHMMGMCEPGKAISKEGKLYFKELFLPPPPPPPPSHPLVSSHIFSSTSSSSSSDRKSPKVKPSDSASQTPTSPSVSPTKLNQADSCTPSPSKKSMTHMNKVLSSKAAGRKLIDKEKFKQERHCPTG